MDLVTRFAGLGVLVFLGMTAHLSPRRWASAAGETAPDSRTPDGDSVGQELTLRCGPPPAYTP